MARRNFIATSVIAKRKAAKLSQPALAAKAGVGVRFIRDLEQGKKTMRMDKVNQVLLLFGQTLAPVPIERQVKANAKG